MPIAVDMRRPAVALRAMLAIALSALTGACASSGAVPRPFPVPRDGHVQTPPDPQASIPSSPEGNVVVETALSLRGAPYRNGGASPAGFDCSGFTKYVYARHGVELAREVVDQFQQGTSVKAEDLVAGDLLFFRIVAESASSAMPLTSTLAPTHVAIAIGGDRFVHAPSSTGWVRVERLGASYWSARYIGARRMR